MYYDPRQFSNGQTFSAAPGEDITIYYPNDNIMANHWTPEEQALYWPYSYIATDYFRSFDETWW
jgi:hypothetical protein|tara:strand:- start:191 stop:382 length:192 start_codon:yes stop_codon:yes gene_type:complete